jgi:hypothetical protein
MAVPLRLRIVVLSPLAETALLLEKTGGETMDCPEKVEQT